MMMLIVFTMKMFGAGDLAAGETVLVTGGGRGIGLATGRLLKAAGWNVVLLDLGAFDEGLPAEFDCRVADVSDTDAVNRLISGIVADHGGIGGLVNAAGYNRHEAVEELHDETWIKLLDVHVGGVLRVCRAAAKSLKERRGAVVNFSSIAGHIGRPRRGPYSAAKAGIEGLTRTLAVEWAPFGVRVNAVVPGIVNTRLVQQNIAEGRADRESLVRSIPLKRMAEPEELASVVEFLLSGKASYITGQSIVVDGGAIINGDW